MKQLKILLFIVIFLALISLTDATLCYQESANTSNQGGLDGDCDLNYSGNYTPSGTGWSNPNNTYDGDWDTYGSGSGGSNMGVYYIKPDGFSIGNNVTYRVKDFQSEKNLTLPLNCTNYSNYIHVGYTAVISGPTRTYFYCFDELGEINILSDNSLNHTIFEEGIYWELNESINHTLLSPDDNETILRNKETLFRSQINSTLSFIENISLWSNESGVWKLDYSVDKRGLNITDIIQSFFVSYNVNQEVKWAFKTCIEDFCSFSENRTIHLVEFIENSQTFNSTTFESASEEFVINLTYDSSNLGISAILVYNNTNYSGTQSGSGDTVLFSRAITIPLITIQENKTFFWLIGLTNISGTFYYNSSFNNQTIKTLSIDDCSVHSNVIMNISLFDEETRNYVDTSGSNIEIEINYGDISYYNNFTNRNNVSICMSNLSFGNIINTTIKYSSTGRVIEYYYIDNHVLVSGDVPFILNLYNLNSSKSTSYLNTYKDCFFLLVDNAIIEVWRKYVSEGTFYLVEMARTNEVGQAVSHLVSEDVIYYYKVRKDGVLEYITPEFNALCIDTPCQVNINQKGIYCDEETFDPYRPDTSILYDFIYNSSTRTLTLDFSTVDGSTATLNLTVKLFNQYLNSTTCSKQVTSAGGTLTCVLVSTLLNSTYYGEVTKNGKYLDSIYINLNVNPREIFGLDGVLMTALLILTLGLMFIPTGWGVPVVAVLGFIMASIISLISWNYTLLIWLSVASLVIVLKIAKKQDSG